MRIRKVDQNGDYVFGGGQAAFLQNSPDAVGLLVKARLHLWQGQWWLNTDYGTPYEQQVLGRRTEGLRDPALQARILDTQGVTEIKAYTSVLDRQTRALTVSAEIETVYSAAALARGTTNVADITVKVEDGR
jgi:hypothetical protein